MKLVGQIIMTIVGMPFRICGRILATLGVVGQKLYKVGCFGLTR